MRRRFENVNMVMGNCFSPVMEGSQFQWNNIVVNSPVYITPIRRKKFKISFGEFDLSKVLSNVSSNCDRMKLILVAKTRIDIVRIKLKMHRGDL